MSKRRTAVVNVPMYGTIADEFGEVVAEKNRYQLVRAYSMGVEDCVKRGMPDTNFRLIANKHGQILTAMGPIVIQSLDMAFPGCVGVDDVLAADAALNTAGATRGNSPAGRALDWTLRKNKEILQWRVKRHKMEIFASTLFGGIQVGGTRKPLRKEGRINMDIVSSYPFMATLPLPRVRDGAIERGLRPHAVLLLIDATQSDGALFSRTARGNACHNEQVYGWYCKEEIDYHVDMGRLRINGVVKSLTLPHSDKYLAPAVDHFFTHREKYPRGSVERGAIKTALNGLLGKFASPISTWRAPKALELEEAKRNRNATTIELGRSALINDSALVGIYPRHCNVIWTSLTYARARVRLWQKIDEIERVGGKVLWAHTDAIIADIPAGYTPATGTALGDWRIIE